MQFMTLAKAAEQIGVSLTTVKRWARLKDRPLQTAVMGSMVVTSAEWLEEFARPVEHESPAEADARAKVEMFKARWGCNQPVRTVG